MSKAKGLIVVESPAKVKTLTGFLGKDYQVLASYGHVCDLPKSRLGVDVDNGFKPTYVIIPGHRSQIQRIILAAKEVDEVLLATDPDREGEAIAWHVSELLNGGRVKRIEFNEITRTAVLNSLKHPREIDINRVYAQQARRVLDRLVGYKLSPVLWKKIKKNLSAGRVQSVALRLICDREQEIRRFKPEEFWVIAAELSKQVSEEKFVAKLAKRDGKKYTPKNEAEAKTSEEEIRKADFIVAAVETKRSERKAPPPFTTSSLQQEASRHLSFAVSKTMRIAQRLYEGVDLPGKGVTGLITYMRTDSVRIAKEAVDTARSFIRQQYGTEFLPASANHFRSRKGAQEAHECIRPTDVTNTPEAVKGSLSAEEFRLYNLIWRRFVACQMSPAKVDVVTAHIGAGRFEFQARGEKAVFAGYLAVYQESKKEDSEDESGLPIPTLTEGEKLMLHSLQTQQKFTQPPPRYTEATLVRALEENGIGRPSTYAQIVSIIIKRRYVELKERRFHPTELGAAVNDFLVEHMPSVVEVQFTAAVEEELDEVEKGKRNWSSVLASFYKPFMERVKNALDQAKPIKIEPVLAEQNCPICGKPMAVRSGRYGKFLGCTGYPACKTILPIEKSTGVRCGWNGCEGELVQKTSKKGRVFYGCNKYPVCQVVTWNPPTDKRCSACGYVLTVKKLRGRETLICENKECGHKTDQSALNEAATDQVTA